MKLNYEQIRSIVIGADHTTEENGLVSLFRFTEEQKAAYEQRSTDFYNKSFATAGIRLEFETDSPSLFLSFLITKKTSSRRFFAHDVYANGRFLGQLGGVLSESESELPLSVCRSFSLGEGTKTVRVYLPWSVQSQIAEISLADGATLAPVKKDLRMICFGDSITHGYDAEHPSLSYANRIVDVLNADAVNKGIGGERFWPALAATRERFEPDLITVAYGTNDWTRLTREEWIQNATDFYQTLSATYPKAKIFALSPIWRGDKDTERQSGPFADLPNHLKKIASKLPNVTVIDCYPFVPHHSYAFHDKKILHPNDAGFGFYADCLIKEMKQYL